MFTICVTPFQAGLGKSHVADNTDGFPDLFILTQNGTSFLHKPAMSTQEMQNQAILYTTNVTLNAEMSLVYCKGTENTER